MPQKKEKKSLSKEETLKKYGVRSGLEVKITEQLNSLNIPFKYEPFKVKYTQPESYRSYTPDYVILHNNIIIESKGIFARSDRQKHEWIKEQHPELDIRFVFSNPNAKIIKGSKTSYADWCDKKGFMWAKGLIPEEWLK
jgi:hypothetical protein